VEAKGHAEVEERALKIDAVMFRCHVPGIAPAVAVGLREDVCGPRIRCEHDRDAARSKRRGLTMKGAYDRRIAG
jgi:hypothetical protein